MLLTVFAFLSLNASSIPQDSPSSDSSSQPASSASPSSVATISPSAPDASAVGGPPAGDSPQQPANALASSAHMVHLMWVLAARSLHGRLVWLACPGALALAAAALGFIGALRYHRSCLTWVCSQSLLSDAPSLRVEYIYEYKQIK